MNVECSKYKNIWLEEKKNRIMEENKLKVFVVSRKADWCEDDAIAVLAVDKLHAERCARCNSSYFAKGEVIVTEIKADREKVILISNVGA